MKNYKSISLHLNTVCIEPFDEDVFTSMMHNTVRIIMTLNLEDFAYGHGKLRITSFGIFTYQHGYAKKLLMQKKIGIQNFVPFHHATKTPQAKLET